MLTQLNALDGRYCESSDVDGNWKPVWAPLLGSLTELDELQVQQFQQDINRRLRENGLAYSAASRGRADQRPWRLDLVPQMMEGADWEKLSRGLRQRARLKAALLEDIYGEQRIFREGVIPPQAVFAHKGYMESVGGGSMTTSLPSFSVDVSRSPSGDWHVVDDICQYPTGVGYALENRLILSSTLSTAFRSNPISRVAGYFKQLQSTLFQQVDHDARCVILGYGSSHHDHFEQAYLAKYLGYTLVEINDLTVRDQRVWLKTVNGKQRVDVIFRFIEDRHIDPLAVDDGSAIGIPGLLQTAREGNVKIINPVGSAVLENPALNEWLPQLCECLLGETAEILSAPTYWLGSPQHRAMFLKRYKTLLLRNIDTRSELIDPSVLTTDQFYDMCKKIDDCPERYVAQERIDRSLSPTLTENGLELRQLTMRLFLTKNDSDYTIMPSGLGLLDDLPGGSRSSIRKMETNKDIWVVSKSPLSDSALLPPPALRADSLFEIVDGELPSRVAENLFWLGRYTERTENTVRLLRAICRTIQIDDRRELDNVAASSLVGLLKSLTAITGTEPGFTGKGAEEKINHPDEEILDVLCNTPRIGSLSNNLEQMSISAAALRDRLSADLMRVINQLEDQLSGLQELHNQQLKHLNSNNLSLVMGRLNDILLSLAAFSGLIHENLTHGDSWRFLQLGRRIERAQQTTVLLSTVLAHDRHNKRSIEDLLGVLDSIMTYRSRYRTHIEAPLALHLLLIDESNPRSVGYQLKRIEAEINALPALRRINFQNPILKIVTVGLSRVRLAEPSNLLKADESSRQSLEQFFSVLNEVSTNLTTALSAQFFTHTDVPKLLGSNKATGMAGTDKEIKS